VDYWRTTKLAETFTDLPETRFIGLMSELFQLREAEELDFGIFNFFGSSRVLEGLHKNPRRTRSFMCFSRHPTLCRE
jgi:hypothetical protein